MPYDEGQLLFVSTCVKSQGSIICYSGPWQGFLLLAEVRSAIGIVIVDEKISATKDSKILNLPPLQPVVRLRPSIRLTLTFDQK